MVDGIPMTAREVIDEAGGYDEEYRFSFFKTTSEASEILRNYGRKVEAVTVERSEG